MYGATSTRPPLLAEGLVQDFGLGGVAREAVEQDARCGVRLGQPLEKHLDRHRVGHELAAVHVALGEHTKRRPVADGGPEQIAGGDVGEAQPLRQDLGLRPLAGARGAQQDDDAADARPSPDEALVAAHHQLRLELLHRLDDDADDDQDAGAAEADADAGVGRFLNIGRAAMTIRQNGDGGHEDRAGDGDPERHAAQVLLGRRAGPDARDEAAGLAQVVGRLIGLEDDERVEEREREGEQEVQAQVQRTARGSARR